MRGMICRKAPIAGRDSKALRKGLSISSARIGAAAAAMTPAVDGETIPSIHPARIQSPANKAHHVMRA